MKKRTSHQFSLAIVLLFTLFIGISSCKKNDRILSEIDKPQEANDYQFLKNELKQFARVFAPALSNKEVRDFIRSKAKEKFDEEYEVLVNDLFKNSLVTSFVPISENKKLHDNLLKRSGEHIYPQIYIPHFQYLEDYPEAKGGTNQTIETDTISEEPVYVFYSGDPEVDSAAANDVWPGFKLVNGDYQFFTMVDETYANEHEVWVFGLNEVVNAAGRLTPFDPCDIPNSPDCGGGGGGGGGVPTGDPDDDPTDAPAPRIDFPELGHTKTNFKMTSMTTSQYKETWVAGASEVSIRAKLVCHNGREMGVAGAPKKEYSSDQYSNYRGKLIKKVKRKDIKNAVTILLNYPLQTNWQNQVIEQDPIHFFYVIFERDIWPASKNKNNYSVGISLETQEPSPGTFPLWYRAGGSEAAYDAPYSDHYFTSARRSWWISGGYHLTTQILSPQLPPLFDFTTEAY